MLLQTTQETQIYERLFREAPLLAIFIAYTIYMLRYFASQMQNSRKDFTDRLDGMQDKFMEYLHARNSKMEQAMKETSASLQNTSQNLERMRDEMSKQAVQLGVITEGVRNISKPEQGK